MPRVVTLLLLVVAFTVSGCATKKVYPGPELPREKVAIITSAGAHIGAIDGWAEPTVPQGLMGFWDKFSVRDFAVKPGKHRVEVYLRRCITIGVKPPITVCNDTPASVLSFEAEANHTYVVHGERFFNPRYWIEEEQTRQVVGRYPE